MEDGVTHVEKTTLDFFFWTNGHEIVPISMIENNTGCRADCKLYMALYIGLAMRSMDTVMDVEPAV